VQVWAIGATHHTQVTDPIVGAYQYKRENTPCEYLIQLGDLLFLVILKSAKTVSLRKGVCYLNMDEKPKVCIVVEKGVAYVTASDGVDVFFLDRDIDPDGAIPEEFQDLERCIN